MVSIAISTLQSAFLCVLCAGHKILKAGSLSFSSSSFSTSHSYFITIINAYKPNFSRVLAQLTFKGGHLQNLVCLVKGCVWDRHLKGVILSTYCLPLATEGSWFSLAHVFLYGWNWWFYDKWLHLSPEIEKNKISREICVLAYFWSFTRAVGSWVWP